ncbi:pyridoxal 5'-phosphate synthase glutaminase subunit PdxT [Anaerosacchariphilus polymeriproducens]|uniref:Pyridoxal 5'-phosphate synthase subunit PdxT n=1 Tax=Anaerosacchariphilus polymeriproducens TaxID=1812858 RepID=A0A371AST5_9FIRM|nr:pyridoxal 5'-phosphate synthase glutaminase subunit PdxT [Anaerosacchariphilus polymeriproducens]RDU22633.1 pyridoxal 5'-phosphate synthase glutaminase subunit PdxT [Anaerosacchariphilus polymeriproducens]
MKIGILALQGAFWEHAGKLKELGVESFEIRKKTDLQQSYDGLILPGGESTVMGKLLKELDLFQPLYEKIKDGLPVLATCSGLILLASELSNDSNSYFATMPIKVRRNAYGRQLGSFSVSADVKNIGKVPLVFIRAPYIESVENSVEVLATVNDRIVAARYQNQLGLAFHPEITQDSSIHRYFISICKNPVPII